MKQTVLLALGMLTCTSCSSQTKQLVGAGMITAGATMCMTAGVSSAYVESDNYHRLFRSDVHGLTAALCATGVALVGIGTLVIVMPSDLKSDKAQKQRPAAISEAERLGLLFDRCHLQCSVSKEKYDDCFPQCVERGDKHE